MLQHHSQTDYSQAAKAAAIHARAKLQELIEIGEHKAGKVIDQVQNQLLADYVVRGTVLDFFQHADGVYGVKLPTNPISNRPSPLMSLHPAALRQVATKANIPTAYADRLATGEPWEKQLLVHLLNECYAHHDERFLLRVVKDQVRGFLSSRFARINSRPVVDAFAIACQELGAVAVDGYALDTKIAIKAIIPQIFEPVPGEVMAFGIMLENSEFGHGPLALRTFCLRLWCTNYSIRDENLRRVHLGSQLEEGDLSASDKTMELDCAALASRIGDIVKSSLSPEKLDEYQSLIRRANEMNLTAVPFEQLRKLLSKDENTQIDDSYESEDVSRLPPGKTVWRMSNAISWLAGQLYDPERKLELMRISGKVLDLAA